MKEGDILSAGLPSPWRLRRRGKFRPVARAITFLTLLLVAGSSLAATVTVTARDARGAALEDAVVWALPRSGPAPARNRPAAVEQRDKAFVPIVSVVQVGTLVSFPNRDETRHHVYSFSPAKVFEIKLYAGTPADPILFDKPGEVVLGCNIHDHMYAYIYVVESPWFAKANKEGVATLDVPAGDYEVHAWYFAQAQKPASVPVRVRGDEAASAEFAFTLRPMPPRPARRACTAAGCRTAWWSSSSCC
jgi:plastocyanin